jgi:hypothetical protein
MRFKTICATIPLTLLAACGGSSNDGGNAGTPPPPASLAISAGNAAEVSGAAYGAATSSGELTDLSGSAGIMGGGAGSFSKATVNGQVKATVGGLAQQVPIGSGPVDCLVNGTVDISGDIQDPIAVTAGILTPGDTFSVEYVACDDGVGEILDGRIDMVVGDPFTGNISNGAYELTMDIEISNFQVTTATDVITSNGDTSTTLNTLAAPYIEASVGGNSITVDANAGSETLSAYSSEQTFDGRVAPAPYTMAAAGTLDSTQIGGVVDYSTPVTFEGVDTGYPTAGVLLVEGENSAARLVAQANGVDVVIEIDADGDGVFEDTINTTWEALTSL